MTKTKTERHGMARFTVNINGTDYTFRLIQNDDEAKLYRLVKSDGTRYTVGCNNTGYVCNCPDNKARHPQGGCKHIKALQANGVI